MYVPASFSTADRELSFELIERHSFGILVTGTSADGAGIEASHLPFLIDRHADGSATLIGHVARANPHTRAIETGASALAIFSGPHAYVSPRWYAPGPAVPTWNYAAVHITGTLRAITKREATISVLQRLTEIHEANAAEPWSMSALPREWLDALLGAILAFELPVTTLETKLKLSQNRSEVDQRGVIAGLRELAQPNATEAADLMARARSAK